MASPQPGIFAEGTRAHHHLEFACRGAPDGAAARAAVAAAVAAGEEHRSTGGTNLVAGFGAALWATLAPGRLPAGLRPFDPVGPPGRGVPATQRDVWVWLHGSSPDLLFDVARGVTAALAPVADLALEQPGWTYRDSRDLTGFVDGTENPPVTEAPAVALVPEGRPGAGGSHVFTSRWVHDLDRFGALPVAEQERVVGRSKPDSEELAAKPPTAHISRVVVTENGEELEIYRRSTPYGTVAEAGLYFVAFSADVARFDRMLARMYGVADGVADALTEYSRPVSGSYFFAPSLDDLAALAG